MNIFCGSSLIDVNHYEEKLPDGKHKTVYSSNNTYLNSDKFIVPQKHYFFLGEIIEIVQRIADS